MGVPAGGGPSTVGDGSDPMARRSIPPAGLACSWTRDGLHSGAWNLTRSGEDQAASSLLFLPCVMAGVRVPLSCLHIMSLAGQRAYVYGQVLGRLSGAGDPGGKGVVELGPGDEAAGQDVAIKRQPRVQLVVHQEPLGVAHAAGVVVLVELRVLAAPDIPAGRGRVGSVGVAASCRAKGGLRGLLVDLRCLPDMDGDVGEGLEVAEWQTAAGSTSRL